MGEEPMWATFIDAADAMRYAKAAGIPHYERRNCSLIIGGTREGKTLAADALGNALAWSHCVECGNNAVSASCELGLDAFEAAELITAVSRVHEWEGNAGC